MIAVQHSSEIPNLAFTKYLIKMPKWKFSHRVIAWIPSLLLLFYYFEWVVTITGPG